MGQPARARSNQPSLVRRRLRREAERMATEGPVVEHVRGEPPPARALRHLVALSAVPAALPPDVFEAYRIVQALALRLTPPLHLENHAEGPRKSRLARPFIAAALEGHTHAGLMVLDADPTVAALGRGYRDLIAQVAGPVQAEAWAALCDGWSDGAGGGGFRRQS